MKLLLCASVTAGKRPLLNGEERVARWSTENPRWDSSFELRVAARQFELCESVKMKVNEKVSGMKVFSSLKQFSCFP